MREVGYSPNTAVDPQNLTNSKGWKELVEEYLPDWDLLKVHQNALYAKKIVTSPTEPDREIDDYSNQLKAVELGYKVKNKLSPDTMTQVNIGGDMSIKFTKREE